MVSSFVPISYCSMSLNHHHHLLIEIIFSAICSQLFSNDQLLITENTEGRGPVYNKKSLHYVCEQNWTEIQMWRSFSHFICIEWVPHRRSCGTINVIHHWIWNSIHSRLWIMCNTRYCLEIHSNCHFSDSFEWIHSAADGIIKRVYLKSILDHRNG